MSAIKMNNPTLQIIAWNAVGCLQEAYGHCAVANGDDLTILNAFHEGKTIEIRITEKEDE
jgi:hypothetical protein